MAIRSHPKKISAAHLVWTACVIFLFAGCSSKAKEEPREKYSETRLLMSTTVSIDICHTKNQTPRLQPALVEVWERLEDISWRMNVFDEKSDVHKINNAYFEPIAVEEDTFHVIREAIIYSKLTKGAFDITVWPLVKLWRESESQNTLPDRKDLLRAKQGVGISRVRLLPGRQIRLSHPMTKIDLGGIAKGYAIDEAARILRKHSFPDFLIDAGGDLYVGGKNCEGHLWRIGIKDPRNLSNLIDMVYVSNQAVATSGDYEQFYKIQGQIWSHIINPITGFPQKGVVSSTVIAPTAIKADSLATALCVLDPQQGVALIDSLKENTAAMVISSPGGDSITKHESARFLRFRSNP